jgi:hypothetical protein
MVSPQEHLKLEDKYLLIQKRTIHLKQQEYKGTDVIE